MRSNSDMLRDGLPDYYDPDNAANQPIREPVEWAESIDTEVDKWYADINGFEVVITDVQGLWLMTETNLSLAQLWTLEGMGVDEETQRLIRQREKEVAAESERLCRLAGLPGYREKK